MFALSRRLSRSRRMRCRVGYYILCTSPSDSLRRGCGLSLSICFWIQLAVVVGFRRVSSLVFSSVFSWVLYRCLIVDISVCNSWGLSYFLLDDYHHLSVLPRCGSLSDKRLVYSLASVFEMVSSPAFNVSMFIWSLPVAVPFFISRTAATTSHDVISGTPHGSTWIMVLCSLSYSAVLNSSILSMTLSWSWISLPCLSVEECAQSELA